MPFSNVGLHHFQKRKRIHSKQEIYPSPNKTKNIMDKLIYLIVFIAPIMTIPQLMKIWVEKNAGGLSILSWTTYALGSILWLSYGFIHREKPIIISNIIWIIIHTSIIIGIILYG